MNFLDRTLFKIGEYWIPFALLLGMGIATLMVAVVFKMAWNYLSV